MKIRFGALALAAAAAFGMSGFAAATEITFWHSMGGVNGDALNYLVEEYNAKNDKGVTVKAQYQGNYDDSINKLKSAMIGGAGPDIVQVYDIGTRLMIDSGWAVPMQDLIDADKYDVSAVEPNIAAYYTIGGKLYSMPFNSSTPIMYYNKDIFEKAGMTKVPDSLEGIGEAGRDLVEKGGAGEAISLGMYGWFFEQMIGKQGLDYANNGNGRQSAATAVAFDGNGAGLKILEAWKELHDAGWAPNVGSGSDSGLADFSAGKSAMTLGSTASLAQILKEVGDKFRVGTAFFPKVASNDEGGVSIGGASLWVIKKDGDDAGRQALVWDFVKFLISPASQAYWNAHTGYFPITVAAHDEAVFKDNVAKYPQFMTAIDQLHASAPQYAGALLSVFPEARQIEEKELENTMNGKKTPEQAVTDMAAGINKAISEYNLVNQ